MKKKLVSLIVLAFIVAAIPLTVNQVEKRQRYQGKAIADCQPACEEGYRCYATTACQAGVCSPTTYACVLTSAPLADTPVVAQDGLYHCSGCSTIYDKTFARWASTTIDCESGIVADSQKYTPNCGCSAAGKPVYSGTAADCSPSGIPLFQCSGCDLYNSTQRMFVTWLSRYPDCSDKIQDPVNGIEPVYTQDLSCAAYAGQRAVPTPTPMPEGECSISVSNNPCQITNWTTTGQGRCTTKVNWSTNGDIKIYFQTAGGLSTTPYGNPLASGTGNGSKWFQVDLAYSSMTVVGVVNGVVMCTAEVSAVQPSGEIPIPSLPAPVCQYEPDGKTPICVNEGVPGSQVIGPAAGCMPGETKCGAWFDACGCPGRFWCVEGRHADCNEAEDDSGASFYNFFQQLFQQYFSK